MDAQLSTMLSIALARALEARPGTPRVGIPAATEQPLWVAPRVSAATARDTELARGSREEEPNVPESALGAEAFVSGTLDMVAYGRHRADALVEYPVDRDTVP